MNKIIKPMFSMLFLSMIAFLIKVVTNPKGEISSLQQMKKQTEILKNTESRFVKEINNQDFYTSSKISNVGIPELDKNNNLINQVIKKYPKISKDVDKNKFSISAHFLIFEYSLTKSLFDICSAYGSEINDYFPLFYENNKNIRSMIMAYMTTNNYMDSLKSAVNEIVLIPEVKQNINNFNERFINEISYSFGKDINEICKTLPMANLAFGENFMNKLKYDYSYAKNYKTIMEN